MRVHRIVLFAITPFMVSAFDLGQIITDLPKCALNCSISIITTTSPACGLAAPDTTCLCSNTTLQRSLSTCIQGQCNFTEQILVASVNNNLCPHRSIENHGEKAVWVGVGMGVASLLAVSLRLYSRYLTKSGLWLDDWAIIVAAIILCGIISTDVLDYHLGLGRHLWNVEISNIIPLTKVFLAAETLYVSVLMATKVSILLFYLRVFMSPWFRMAVKATIIFVLLWGITFIFVVVFQCKPVRGAWDKTIESTCVNTQSLAYSAAGVGIGQDFLILLLPVPELKSLQMKWTKKMHTIAMFSIGGFACVTSIIRLRFIVKFGNSRDPTWDNVIPSVWSLIEVNVAMLCACLPAIRVVVKHWLPTLTLQPDTKKKSNYSNPSSNWSSRKAPEPSSQTQLDSGYDFAMRSYSQALNPVRSKVPGISTGSKVSTQSPTGSQDDLVLLTDPGDHDFRDSPRKNEGY
ncbi:integral membrane protein [Phlyctema vagabunda]|uniref:Integral membrane protein n=1 Tax=Phlyctema vagabunda TaxID=108571 RepID=A0ABR4PWC7_9HELO